MLCPEFNALLGDLPGFAAGVATWGCFVVGGEILELFVEQLEFFGLVRHLCHEGLVLVRLASMVLSAAVAEARSDKALAISIARFMALA